MTTEAASTALRDFISKLNVDAVGVVSLAEWKGTQLEESALRLLPQARSVVVLAMEVYREFLDLVSPGRVTGEASFNDLVEANSDFVNSKLTEASYGVARASHELGLRALPLPAAGSPTDDRFLQAVFSYKHAALAAGLGTIGKNSLLITQEYGPRIRLSCCLTEVLLEQTRCDKPWKCAGCRICIAGCPSEALSEPQDGEVYSLNRFACSSFLSASDGCYECLRLCPAGQRGKRPL
ncbi:MAG: hypothetical protein ABID84_02330 [Chloroflexota bacterium]